MNLNNDLPLHGGEKTFVCDAQQRTYPSLRPWHGAIFAPLRLQKAPFLPSLMVFAPYYNLRPWMPPVWPTPLANLSGYASGDACQKIFVKKEDLASHLRVHTREKTFVCEICQKGFTQNSSLKRHLYVHSKEKPFVCEICQKGFTRNYYLKIHLYVHSKEKPFVCEICQKGFTQNSDLRRHLYFHSGEKPFVCEIFEKRFTEKK